MLKVAVVILNFKVKNETLKCVFSVKKSDYQNIEVIVVDNNSGDGIEEEINKMKDVLFLNQNTSQQAARMNGSQKNLPEGIPCSLLRGSSFIQSKGNLGYTGGNNLGIKKAMDNGADYLFVLNPDTEIEKTAISNLVNIAEKEQAGISGPKILFMDKKTIWYAGGIFDVANVLGSHRGVDEKDQGQHDKIEETEFVTGGAMFVKSEVFKKIGLFDEKYFMYLEDSDLCFRAKKEGIKILYNPKAVVYHENAKSAGLGSSLQDYFITRNRMLFASKFLPLRTRFALLREALRNILIPARRLALFDFLMGNFGKGSFLK